MSAPELDDLADAITAVASARNRIALPILLRETALNVLVLTRFASNRIGDKLRREDIESAADHLVTPPQRLGEVLDWADELLTRDDQKVTRPQRRGLFDPATDGLLKRIALVDLALGGDVDAAPVGEGDPDVISRIVGLEVETNREHPRRKIQARDWSAAEPVHCQVGGDDAAEHSADLVGLPCPAQYSILHNRTVYTSSPVPA